MNAKLLTAWLALSLGLLGVPTPLIGTIASGLLKPADQAKPQIVININQAASTNPPNDITISLKEADKK